jgi:TRAP-type uncharacterized transport system fused permease subunit
LAIVTASIGIVSLACSLEGFVFGRVGMIGRAFLFAAALFLIKPGLYTDLVGIIILSGIALPQWLNYRSRAKSR